MFTISLNLSPTKTINNLVMYVSKKDREVIRLKFNGKCAYSGTDLESDWQIDHADPVVRNWWTKTAVFENNHNLDNMFPTQKQINHYKHSYHIESFRGLLNTLHIRLKKVPENPYTEKGIKKKAYILKLAAYFGITKDNPFSGKFYFETLNDY